ncbi:hypothetical protein HYFRA_00007041 [Hymenoscyphus fraxineus]|uniref:NAD(P)-binding protein n=1 Tax=Hymenoscyphus fraxineus TaxID=746836 RepID=A0A9N9PUY9_9HELO|nr:hypothetical protein HYFRA_00007041 [Hymenoscyphus fraxineus]
MTNTNGKGAKVAGVAIVTGCASGVGLATTIRFLTSNYHVFGVDINEMDYAELGEAVEKENFHFHRANLLEDGKCEEVIEVCLETFGSKLEVLANVAGIMDGFSAADTFGDEEWDRVIGINLTVPTRLIRASIPPMKANGGGSIINVCSKASTSGAVAGVAYTASKHGLLGVTRNTAFRFRKEGIRCNAVCPGGIRDTGIRKSAPQNIDTVAYEISRPIIEVHNRTSTAEVADSIFFLASDGSKSINGVCLPVDCGWSTI